MAQQSKKVICYILPGFPTGGAETLVLEYVRRLDKRYYDVHVMSVVTGGMLEDAFCEIPGVSVFVGDRMAYGGRRGVFRAAKKYLQDIQPDIIHTHLFGGDFWGWLLLRKLSSRPDWFVTLHNVEQHTSLVRRMVWRYLLKKADCIIAVSAAVASYARQAFQVKKEKVYLLPNAIDLDTWIKVPMHKVNATVTLASVGRLSEQKGHRYLFQALSIMKERQWHLHIYGSGELHNELKQLAKQLNIDTQITWHGVVNDLASVYKDVDIVIQASLWEGMSLAIMEAMAAGKCVVASTAAGSELIEHNKTGYLVETKNSKDLAKVLDGLCTQPEVITRFGKAARSYAKKHFDFSTHIEKLDTFYRKNKEM